MKQPLILLPMRWEPARQTFYLRRHYAEAVFESGGVPVYVPLIPDASYIDELTSHADGIILTGSQSDIDPARYGQEPHPQLGAVHQRRDEVDMLLLKAAEQRHLPVLGICFGMQSLNVYRGGTLIQDISEQLNAAIEHEQPGPYDQPAHEVELSADSILAQLAGTTVVQVNSLHHQAVDRIGQGLQPIAWAPDGVVEALVNTLGDQLMLAVQWHPELSFAVDPFSRQLFSWFIEQVREVHR